MMKFRGIHPSLRVLNVCLVLFGLWTEGLAQKTALPTVAVRPRLVANVPLLRFTPEAIHTVAGSGFAGESSYNEGGAATQAALGQPFSVAVDASGNLFIAMFGDNTVRRVDAVTGVITTVAGVPPQTFQGEARQLPPVAVHASLVSATSVTLNAPQSVVVDAAGNLYIASTNDHVVYKVDVDGNIVPYAGMQGTRGYTGDGGAATSALLYKPAGLSLNAAGDLFIADTRNNVVRKVAAATGVITTVAGNQSLGAGFAGDGGVATSARMNRPTATAVDALGNLFIADSFNSIVRRVDATTGVITTFAGTRGTGSGGDGGPATSAQMNQPNSLALDAAGDLFIGDVSGSVVRRVDKSGTISTVAGRFVTQFYSQYGGDGGPATQANFNEVEGIAVDAAGSLFVIDSLDGLVLKLGPGGRMDFGDQPIHTTVSGLLTLYNPSTTALQLSGFELKSESGFLTNSSAPGTCDFAGQIAPGASCTLGVTFSPPSPGAYTADLVVSDTAGDSPQTVVITGNGILTPSFTSLTITPGSVPAGQVVTFTVKVVPVGVTTPIPTGTVAIVDQMTNQTLATVALDSSGNGTFTTSALAAGQLDFVAVYAGDSSYAASASIDQYVQVLPKSVSVALQTSAAVISLHDSLTLTATVTSAETLSGGVDFYSDGVKLGSAGMNGAGVAVYVTTALQAGAHVLQARFVNPAFSPGISNQVGVRVRGGVLQFQPSALYTIAGTPSDNLHGGFSGDGGLATAARMHTPQALVVDAAKNIYIADEENNVIRKVDAVTGIISTYAGIPYAGSIYSTRFGGDGGPATSAYLDNPAGIGMDGAGNLFICDYSNNVVRRVDAITGIITTVAGVNGTSAHNVDSGPATTVHLSQPSSVAFDKAGNMYIADTGNNLIRKVDTGGQLTTIAGLYGYFSSVGSLATQTVLNKPMGVTVDLAGRVIFSDTYANAVRRINTDGTLTTLAGNVYSYSPYGDGGVASASSLSFPEQLAVDVAGNLFIADNAHNLIRRVDAVTGLISTVAGINGGTSSPYFTDPAGLPATYTPLAAPYGIAIDYAGALYITDTYNQTVLKSGPAGTLLFGPQAVGSTSAAQTLTVSNAGDLPIHFAAGTPYSVTGDYSASAGGPAPCDFSAALAVGAACTMQVTFTPTSTTFSGGTIAFASDAVNSPQMVNLVSHSTTQPVTISHYANTSQATYGDEVLLIAQVAGTGIAPTGTVTFFAGTTNLGSAPLASGVAYLDLKTLPAGVLTTTAVYSGDAFYSATTSSPNAIQVDKAATSTTLGVSATTIAFGDGVGFTATVSSPAVVPITGTVSFLDGGLTLGTVALVADGTASYMTTSLSLGTNSITAKYNGTANIAASTSAAIHVEVTGGGTAVPDYQISAGPLPVVIHRGSTATVGITITPVNGYTGTVHLGCGTMPAYATCSFSATDVVIAGAAQTVVWTITTTALPAGSAVSRALVVQSTGGSSLPTVMFVK